MLKKVLLTFLLIHSATVGLNTAYAEEPIVHNEELAGQTSENLTSPLVETSAEEPAVVFEDSQEVTTPENVNQDQSTDQKVTQGQDIKGDNGDPEQDQTADINVCQEQSVSASISCEDKIETGSEAQGEQEQTTSVETGQVQNVDSIGSVKAEQKQGTNIDSKQSQEMSLPEGQSVSQSQGTNAVTDQNQTAIAENQADISQGQGTDIVVSQKQELASKEDKQRQETTIDADQAQVLSTSGSSKMEQTQSAEVSGYIVDALKQAVEVGVKVTTKNYLEVIKDTTSHMVKFIQEIFVNDELVDVIDDSYALVGTDTHVKMTNYEKQYDWGSLVVGNSASIFFSESLEKYTSTMNSFLTLVFGLGHSGNGGSENPDPVNPDPIDPDPVNPDPVNPDPVDPDPITPDPVDPGLENPDPVTPDPVVPATSENTPPVTAENPVTTAPVVETVQKPAEPIKVETVVVAKKGNELPDTATGTYNYLVLGMLLTVGGIVFLFQRRRS
ncbi:LPXTG cell wall anchor domain-containing protein [Neobacillus sp. 3P2-tot-E-2]|uniref:LPXTG cell wall anchor domain-containing protein n=1 Tax=Neobacillus sp. 3P2-tot-E-2 TaxID=3132212 RepID=UPI00399F125F